MASPSTCSGLANPGVSACMTVIVGAAPGSVALGCSSLAMPKSSSFTRPSGVDEDVAGLEVAVDDQTLMRVTHRAADVAKELQPLTHPVAALLAIAVERLAVDELHHEVRQPVVGRAAVDEPRDVGVLEAREDLALRAQALQYEARADSRQAPA